MYRSAIRLGALAAVLREASAIALNATDLGSVRSVAQNLTLGVISYYQNANATGDENGLFPFLPYYWWESGAIWGGFMDYQALTGDTTYEQDILNAMFAQVGPNYDFVMPNQVSNEVCSISYRCTHSFC